jgi:hypothetical protein
VDSYWRTGETAPEPVAPRRAPLALVDWVVVGAAAIVDLSLILPWLSLGGYALRPVELAGAWLIVALLVAVVLATVFAGRWPRTRWLALLPLGSGCLLLGLLAGVVGVAWALNPLLAGLPWSDVNALLETIGGVAGLLRLPLQQIEGPRAIIQGFTAEPQIGFRAGSWLFGLGAVALIAAGYRKVVATFAGPPAADYNRAPTPRSSPPPPELR